jgi:hypothetical protein
MNKTSLEMSNSPNSKTDLDPDPDHKEENEVIAGALAEQQEQLLQGLHSLEIIKRLHIGQKIIDHMTTNPSPSLHQDHRVAIIVTSLQIVKEVDLLQGLMEALLSEGVIIDMLRREIEEGASVLTSKDQRRTSLRNQISILIDSINIETLENSIENHIETMPM